MGLYGVLSYVVAQRTREIGVRMALGAEARRVRRMVVGQGARVWVGVAHRVAVAAASTRALRSLLFGVGALDPVTFARCRRRDGARGPARGYLPARRASRVDPIESLEGRVAGRPPPVALRVLPRSSPYLTGPVPAHICTKHPTIPYRRPGDRLVGTGRPVLGSPTLPKGSGYAKRHRDRPMVGRSSRVRVNAESQVIASAPVPTAC